MEPLLSPYEPVPPLDLQTFCTQYYPAIYQFLVANGYSTVQGVSSEYGTRLEDAGLPRGYVVELKRALKQASNDSRV